VLGPVIVLVKPAVSGLVSMAVLRSRALT